MCTSDWLPVDIHLIYEVTPTVPWKAGWLPHNLVGQEYQALLLLSLFQQPPGACQDARYRALEENSFVNDYQRRQGKKDIMARLIYLCATAHTWWQQMEADGGAHANTNHDQGDSALTARCWCLH